MHPRFSAIFSDFSRFSVHRQCLSHSISLFRIFSRFFILLLLGGLCGLSRAGERGRMTGEGMGHCASVSLSVPLSCVSGGGVLYLPSPGSLAVWGFLGASCVICWFSRLPAPVPPLACPAVPPAPLRGFLALSRDPAPASPLHRLRGMCCGVGEYLMLRGSYQMVSR